YRGVAQVDDLGEDLAGVGGVESLTGGVLEFEVRAAEAVGLAMSDPSQALGIGGDQVQAEVAVLRGGDDEVIGDVAAEHVVLLAAEGDCAIGGRRGGRFGG